MKESEIVAKIQAYLKTVKDLFFWKEHGGIYGTAGIPDLICCYRGRFIAFEVKTQKNDLTVLQGVTLQRIIKAGGYALTVRSEDEVKNVIEALSKELV